MLVPCREPEDYVPARILWKINGEEYLVGRERELRAGVPRRSLHCEKINFKTTLTAANFI